MVHMLAVSPLGVQLLSHLEVGVLERFDVVGDHFHGEGAEVLEVNALPVLHFFPDVLGGGLDDDVELGLRLEGLVGGDGSGLRFKVLPGVVLRVGKDPRCVRESRYQL